MNYEDQVLALFGEANPVSDLDTLEDLMSPRLEVVEQRTGDMTDTKRREIDPNRPIFKKDRRFGLVYGLAAALVVLMIGSVVWAVFLNDSEPDVAPQPAPTPTTVPPVSTVDASQRALIDEFIANFNTGDVAALMAAVGPDTVFHSTLMSSRSYTDALTVAELGGENVSDFLEFTAVVHSELSIIECQPGREKLIGCQADYSDDVTRGFGSGAITAPLIFEIGPDGGFTYVALEPVFDQLFDPFVTFFEFEVGPGENAAMWTETEPVYAELDAESRALWAKHVPAWVASLG